MHFEFWTIFISDQKPLKVIVQDLEKIEFQGEVDRISSYNEIGPFDVYPMHANFISIIRKSLTLYKKHEKVKELNIEQAVMKVKQDAVEIFLGIEVLVIDEESIVK